MASINEQQVTMSMNLQNASNDILSAPLIAVIVVIVYLVLVTIIWLIRKCLMNQGMCKQCNLRCDCCDWMRDCCLMCGSCCQNCSVNGCLDSMNCPRHKYYCVDLMCCRCCCPDNSPCVNCCDDMASGSCECCGCQLNFTMAAQTARSPRQTAQQQGYPMYPNVNQPLGGFIPPPYLSSLPQTGVPYTTNQPMPYPMPPGSYPMPGSSGMVGQIPRLNIRS